MSETYEQQQQRISDQRAENLDKARARIAELEAENERLRGERGQALLDLQSAQKAVQREMVVQGAVADLEAQLAAAQTRIEAVEGVADKRGASGRRLDDDDVIQLGELRDDLDADTTEDTK